MFAIFEKIHDRKTPDRPRIVVSRFDAPPNTDSNLTTLHLASFQDREMYPQSTIDDYTYDDDDTTSIGEHIIFVYFDLQSSSLYDFVGQLRAINDYVQIYTNSLACFDFLNNSKEKIFFISSTNDKKIIKDVHDLKCVEAMFILNSTLKIDKNRFPKLFGVYVHQEELFSALRNGYEWFEQTQMHFFSFEHEKVFLWSQLWKEAFINSSYKSNSSDKEKLVKVAEKYYKGNTKLLDAIDNFDCSYEKHDALKWCFSAQFPSRFLNYSLSTRNPRFIDLCRFLIVDVANVLKQPVYRKSSIQIFKSIKMTQELLEKLVNHTGKLICPKGFFTCTTSRVAALDLVRASDYRPDLKPVLFKLNCDSSVRIGELQGKDSSTLIVFDVYTAFRIKWVTLGPVSIVELESADKDGRNMALEYKTRTKSSNMEKLLNQLSVFPKPPPRLPPIKRPPSTAMVSRAKSLPKKPKPPPTTEEVEAKRMLQRGEIDLAIGVYRTSHNRTPRHLHNLATIYAEKKGNYNLAAKVYKQALDAEEQTGEDITETLVKLGVTHYNRYDFNQALEYHSRALNLQRKKDDSDKALMATNLLGIANAHWGKNNLPDALKHAEEALKLNQNLGYGNELNLAMNYAILANIQHKAGDNTRALEYVQKAMAIIQRIHNPNMISLASILNNLGVIQVALGYYYDAYANLNRALKICRKTFAEGHPKRVLMESNIQRTKEIIKHIEEAEKRKRKKED